MSLQAPATMLRPWVECLWATGAADSPTAGSREWVMPDGRAHIAIRLGKHPLGVYDTAQDAQPRWIADAVLAGPHDRAYLKDTACVPGSVGALLRVGALQALFGLHAPDLLNQHVPLVKVWPDVTATIARINAAATPGERIACLEAALLARLRPAHGLHPQVASALPQLAQGTRVDAVVRTSGYSHRRFATLFRDATGMSPKRYACLRRFADALPASGESTRWAELALDAGYSDQAHFVRDFHGFARITPAAYRQAERRGTRHVKASPD